MVTDTLCGNYVRKLLIPQYICIIIVFIVGGKMSVLQTRVDDSTREAAEKVLNSLGISIGDGIRMFLKQVHIDQGLPFQPSLERHIPNEATRKVIAQAEAGTGIKTAKTREELFRELGL